MQSKRLKPVQWFEWYKVMKNKLSTPEEKYLYLSDSHN